jgi:hypothetical protein
MFRPHHGYCVAAPGWELTNVPTQTEFPYDELIKPSDASTSRIIAIQLQTGQGLDEAVQAARDIATRAGGQGRRRRRVARSGRAGTTIRNGAALNGIQIAERLFSTG